MLKIEIRDGGSWFKPGETIAGTASWHLDEEGESIEARLFWFTQGKGARDVEIVAARHMARPERTGTMAFELEVPRGPYSFSGKLITLAWAIELVVLPSGTTERLDLTIGPQPVEVDIS
jgi:hypothetical protein